MRHRLQAEYISSGGLLQVLLLLGLIFGAVCKTEVQCSQNLGNKTATVDLTDDLNVGSTAKFKCPLGQYAWPQSTRTCQENGKWTDIKNSFGRKIREISCKKIRCPDPVVFENGEFHPRGPFYVDSNITFICNDGYIPRGSMVRTCKQNAKWSGETAICDDGAGHCPDPGLPPGAIKTGVRYDMDESVSYKCITGLTLIGSSKRTCLESRRWSGTEVSCHFPYTFDLPEEAGELFAGSLSGILRTSEKKGAGGRTVKIQKDGILNVYIILDASQSVGEDNFELFKECAEILVSRLGVFDMKIQFGIISFATEPKVIVSISNNEDADEVVNHIRGDMKYSNHQDKSGTNTYAALRKVNEMILLQKEAHKKKLTEWNSIHHVIVLLTDGKANMGGRPVQMIKSIRSDLNITDKREDYLDVYAFGVGDNTDKTELSELASQKENEKHVFILNSAEEMKNAFHKIINITNYGDMCGLNEEREDSENSFPHPWNVRIKTQSSSPCFGTLISSSWVLSAAHCFNEVNKEAYIFQIGKENYNAEKILIHDCYNRKRKVDRGIDHDFDYDVALVKLNKKVKFSQSARPICLPCTEPANRAMKKSLTASCNDHRDFLLKSSDVPAGYLSKVKKDGNEVNELHVNIKHNNLREACISAIQKADKYKNITVHDLVSPRHLCVTGQMSCKGESGGALFVNMRERARFFQVGILSFGSFNPCKKPVRETTSPVYARDFYVDVLEVLPWLHRHLKEEIQFQPGINDIKDVGCPT